jgi:hypothetical protein
MPKREIADLEKVFYGIGDRGWVYAITSDYKDCFHSQNLIFIH